LQEKGRGANFLYEAHDHAPLRVLWRNPWVF